jgi:cholesterol transport system auxiliary component
MKIATLGGTVAALAMACMAGCSILPKAESPDVYLLPVVTGVAHGGEGLSWSLRVVTPQASNPIDSNRIAVVPTTNQITSYQGARWADRLPVLFRNRLMDAFRQDARVASVSSDDANLQATMELDSQLGSFQSEYENGAPVAVIGLDAQLVATHDHRILASRHFQVREPVQGKAVPQVVEAFGRATNKVAVELVAWAVATKP